MKTFDLSYFKIKGHFLEDGTQNYLAFQPVYKYFKRVAGVGSGKYIYFWKSKGLSDEIINSITTSDYSITPELGHCGTKARVKFGGSCLRQKKATYNHGTIVNIYIVYEAGKNIDQYKYSGYGIGFDKKGELSFGNGFGRNVIIFWTDISRSAHANNRTKNILILGKDFVQGLDNTKIYAEKLYSNNLTKTNTKFCLSLHCNRDNSYLFVNGTEIHKFQANCSEIVAAPLCLGKILKDFLLDIMKKTGLNRYFYDFSVDYDAIAIDDILDIHK